MGDCCPCSPYMCPMMQNYMMPNCMMGNMYPMMYPNIANQMMSYPNNMFPNIMYPNMVNPMMYEETKKQPYIKMKKIDVKEVRD